MSRAVSLIARLNKVFDKLNLTDRVVYKRKTTRTGGDPLIGRPGLVTSVDTKLSPQPAVQIPESTHPLVVSTGGMVTVSDYLIIATPTSISKQDLADTDFTIVLKDGAAEEVLAVITYRPIVLEGKVVVYEILARSRKRP